MEAFLFVASCKRCPNVLLADIVLFGLFRAFSRGYKECFLISQSTLLGSDTVRDGL